MPIFNDENTLFDFEMPISTIERGLFTYTMPFLELFEVIADEQWLLPPLK